MPVKDLLVQLGPDAGSSARLDAALGLARALDARPTALYLVVDPVLSLIELPPERLFRAHREAEADQALAAAAKRAEKTGLALETRRETAGPDRLPALFARHARHADLVIVGRPDPMPDPEGVEVPALAETAFLTTGRPTLLVPPAGMRPGLPARVMVAWDGSREATRAVHDALPFLVQAGLVEVTVVDPESLGHAVGAAPGADIAAHLARHGAQVEVAVVQNAGLPVGEVLLAQAAAGAADLLVMGGYGHWRLRELMLGGTTRHVIAHATLPVLLSH
jgi:nucleotide-binding universal stress UspA family protein